MVLMGMFFILGQSMVQAIGDIHQGDCLTFPDLQAVIETERRDIYKGGDCDINYGVDGTVDQDLVCGLKLETGEWHRAMAKHKKPGFFWPGAAPCFMSPETVSYDNTTYGEVADGKACTKENSFVVKYQQEKLNTKKYGVGQGEAYLPNPLWVHREKFGFNDKGDYERQSCTNSEVVAEYLGWGNFHAKWIERDCETNSLVACREADIKPSETESGQTCGRLEKVWDCNQ